MMKDALHLFKALLAAFFEKKSNETLLSFLTEDVVICGLSCRETITGTAQLGEYLSRPGVRSFADLPFEREEEKSLSETAAYLRGTLTRGDTSVPLCISVVAGRVNDTLKLSFLHFAWEGPDPKDALFRDTSKQKAVETARNMLIAETMGKMKAELSVFQLDEARRRLIPVQTSPSMRAQLGIVAQPGTESDSSYGMTITHPDDRARVWELLAQAVRQDRPTTFTFRAVNGNWFSATAVMMGEQDGLPLLRVLFTPVSIAYDLQLQALDTETLALYIVDEDTSELYYANNAAFRLYDVEPCSLSGQTCHQVFWNAPNRCEWCVLNRENIRPGGGVTFNTPNGKTLDVSVNRREWNGRHILIVCAKDVTREHALRREAENANRDFRSMLENIPSAICLYRWDGATLRRALVGHGFEEIFGKTARQAVDRSSELLFYVVHPDDVDGLKKYLDAFLQENKSHSGLYQYRAWNEEKQAYIWVSAHTKAVPQNDGTLLLYVAYTNETEQVTLANQLADTGAAIGAAIRYGQLGLWTYDLTDGTVCQSLYDASVYGHNPRASYTPEMLVEQKHIHPEDASAYLDCYRAIRSGAEHSDCTMRVLDPHRSEYRWMHLHLLRRPEIRGSLPTALGLSFDINGEMDSYRKLARAQAQLEAEKQVVDDLFANLPGGVALLQWDGQQLQPLYVSNAFADFIGQEPEQGKGLDYSAVHPEDAARLHTFIQTTITQTDRLHFFRYRAWNRKAGQYIWVQLTSKNKLQPDGTILVYASFADIAAEVQAAEKLRREEQLLEKTCRLAHIWMFLYDLPGKRVHLSPILQQDYQLPEIIENYPEAFLKAPAIPADFQDSYRRMVRRLADGDYTPVEMPVQLADGTGRYVRFEWYPTRQEDGKVVEIAGLALDISQEIAERNRFDLERRKILGGDKQLTAYSITDLQRRVIVEAEDYFLGSGIHPGDTCAEFSAKIAPFLFLDKDRARFAEMRDPEYAMKAFRAGQTEWTEDMLWKNQSGHVRWQRSVYSIITNSYTGTQHLYTYLYDVMGEKMMQALFAGIQHNLYLKTGVVSSRTGQFYEFEGDYPNREMHTTQYDPARTAYIEGAVAPEDLDRMREQTSLQNLQKVFADGRTDFSVRYRTRSTCRARYCQVRFAPVPGESDLYILIVRDVTDLIRESEQQKEQLQKALADAEAATKAKSQFLSRMSHEIRTPMNAIIGMTAIAQDNKSDFLQVSDCLSKIDSSSKYLLTLINDILEMSRIESGRTQLSEAKFNFANLISDIRTVVEPLAGKSNIRLAVVNNTPNGSYYGDAIRIQQIMINLLGNAIKFTRENGRVRFEILAAEDTPDRTTFEFLVEDTGIGMSEEFMRKMFEPFSQEDTTTTSRYGGSGLGLAISKSLTEAMGGTIEAESMVGIGTTFTVHIPLKKAQSVPLAEVPATTDLPASEVTAILKGRRVLMAEDHPLNVMVAKKLLERKGIRVTVAENGQAAVDTFRSSAPYEYDAILMDIRMPVMDGLEATRQIRALERPDAKTTPILAMTANALDEDRRNCREAGMDEHLAKPIEPNKMYQLLAKQLSRRNA